MSHRDGNKLKDYQDTVELPLFSDIAVFLVAMEKHGIRMWKGIMTNKTFSIRGCICYKCPDLDRSVKAEMTKIF